MSMSNVLIVEVIQEDIEKGEQLECGRCPVARALQRATGDPIADVVPGEDMRGLCARFHADSVTPAKRYPLPDDVVRRIGQYDSAEPEDRVVAMEPCGFMLEVE